MSRRDPSGKDARARRARRVAYAYCALEAESPPSAKALPPGAPGMGEVRPVALWPNAWLLLSDAPLPAYGQAAIEKGLRDLEWVSARALAHERVVESASRAGPVLPLKLFTLFDDEERAVAAFRRRRRSVARLLERVRGHREWGVRLSVDRRRAEEAARSRPARAGGGGAGARFLAGKSQALAAARAALGEAVESADRIFEGLQPLAKEARRRPPVRSEAGTHLVLDAAFLVPETGERRFLREVQRWADRVEGGGARLALTGPWPPYSFVSSS